MEPLQYDLSSAASILQLAGYLLVIIFGWILRETSKIVRDMQEKIYKHETRISVLEDRHSTRQ